MEEEVAEIEKEYLSLPAAENPNNELEQITNSAESVGT
eukprot:SAG11_NODE_281_length_11257_cov_45.949633_4_plen_38_part_00